MWIADFIALLVSGLGSGEVYSMSLRSTHTFTHADAHLSRLSLLFFVVYGFVHVWGDSAKTCCRGHHPVTAWCSLQRAHVCSLCSLAVRMSFLDVLSGRLCGIHGHSSCEKTYVNYHGRVSVKLGRAMVSESQRWVLRCKFRTISSLSCS